MGIRYPNWKYHFTQKDLAAVSNGVISCQLKRWSAVISLPLRYLAYVVIRSVSNLRLKKKHLVARPNVVKNRIAMTPNMKGFALFTRAINGDVSLLAPDKYRYVLSSSICRERPG